MDVRVRSKNWGVTRDRIRQIAGKFLGLLRKY
jgi:hypothetical protein